jgi:PAS domain S-box-containing protein
LTFRGVTSGQSLDNDNGVSPYSPSVSLDSFVDEAGRLNELAAYNVLDSLPEASFDRITRLAAHIFDVPIAIVSLVAQERHWFKSIVGLDVCEVPRQDVFCGYVAITGEILVIEDTHNHPQLANHPLVTGAPNIRFYAGAPLRTQSGFTLGSLCIIDSKPRTLSASQQEQLCDMAALVVDELELRRASRELRENEECSRALIEATSDIITVLDEGGIIRFESPSVERVLGWTPAQLLGHPVLDWVHPDDAASVTEAMQRSFASLIPEPPLTLRFRASDGTYRTLEVVSRNCFDNPSVGGLVVNSRDISERISMQESLRENQSHLQLALEAGRMGLWQSPVPTKNRNGRRKWKRCTASRPANFPANRAIF